MAKTIIIADVIPLTISIQRDRDDLSRITMTCRYWLEDDLGQPIPDLERERRAVLEGDIRTQVINFVTNNVTPHLRDAEGL